MPCICVQVCLREGELSKHLFLKRGDKPNKFGNHGRSNFLKLPSDILLSHFTDNLFKNYYSLSFPSLFAYYGGSGGRSARYTN